MKVAESRTHRTHFRTKCGGGGGGNNEMAESRTHFKTFFFLYEDTSMRGRQLYYQTGSYKSDFPFYPSKEAEIMEANLLYS